MQPGQRSPATSGMIRRMSKKARQRLAKAMLSVASEDSRDVGVLRRAALQRMALDYRRRR